MPGATSIIQAPGVDGEKREPWSHMIAQDVGHNRQWQREGELSGSAADAQDVLLRVLAQELQRAQKPVAETRGGLAERLLLAVV